MTARSSVGLRGHVTASRSWCRWVRASSLLGDPAQPDRDGYGRLPCYLVVDGRDVQELLLWEGQAPPVLTPATGYPRQRGTPRPRRRFTAHEGAERWAGCAMEGTR